MEDEHRGNQAVPYELVELPQVGLRKGDSRICCREGCTKPRRPAKAQGRPPTTCEEHVPKKRGGVPGTCRIDGCTTRFQWGKDRLCQKHWREANGLADGRRKYKPGHVFDNGSTLIEYTGRKNGGTNGLFLCTCGVKYEGRISYVANGLISSCGERHRHPHPLVMDQGFSYSTQHRVKLISEKGRAGEHRCAFCDNPALDWAYLGSGGIAGRVAVSDHEKGMLYSESAHDYVPLCRACHVRLDRKWTPTSGEPVHAGRAILALLISGDDTEPRNEATPVKVQKRWERPDEETVRRLLHEGLCIVCEQPLPDDAHHRRDVHEGKCTTLRNRYNLRNGTRAYRQRKKGMKSD